MPFCSFCYIMCACLLLAISISLVRFVFELREHSVSFTYKILKLVTLDSYIWFPGPLRGRHCTLRRTRVALFLMSASSCTPPDHFPFLALRFDFHFVHCAASVCSCCCIMRKLFACHFVLCLVFSFFFFAFICAAPFPVPYSDFVFWGASSCTPATCALVPN